MKFLAPAEQLCTRTPPIKLYSADQSTQMALTSSWNKNSNQEADIRKKLLKVQKFVKSLFTKKSEKKCNLTGQVTSAGTGTRLPEFSTRIRLFLGYPNPTFLGRVYTRSYPNPTLLSDKYPTIKFGLKNAQILEKNCTILVKISDFFFNLKKKNSLFFHTF